MDYCRELEDKVKSCVKNIENYKDQVSKEEDNIALLNELEKLERDLFNKELRIKELKEEILLEDTEKDKTMKENVRLKEQQVELKNQMTHLLTFVNASKRESGVKNKLITEFYEEQEKISKITRNLKMIINENKSIFKNISGELCNRNDKLAETIEHAKFLEEKLNERELQYSNLRKQLEMVTSQYHQTKMVTKNSNVEYTERSELLGKQNQQLSQEIEHLRTERNELLKKNENLSLEIFRTEETKVELKSKVEQIQRRFDEIKTRRGQTDDQCMLLARRVEESVKELSEQTRLVNELKARLDRALQEKTEMAEQLESMRDQLKQFQNKMEHEIELLEASHVQEVSGLQERINEILSETKRHMKASEKTVYEHSKEIMKLENQVCELKQQKSEMVEYLYKLPTSSLKWSHFFQ